MYTINNLNNLDVFLLVWQIVQVAGVFFVGFLSYKGLFCLIDERRRSKHLAIDNELDYWSKRVELLKIKDKFKTLSEYYKHKASEVVDIKNFDDLTDEEKEFLKHSDEGGRCEELTEEESNKEYLRIFGHGKEK